MNNNRKIYGHGDAEKVFLDSFVSGKMPHAWLIAGIKGIGKATLAYRFARFLLAGENSNDLFGSTPTSLDIDEDNPIFARIEAGSVSDLFILETDIEKTEIKIDEVRKLERFLSLTKTESNYRVIIIDSVDDMNRNSANALLKMLEEPPENTIMFLISHASGKLLPTIRSRCRFLPLSPLSDEDIRAIMEERGLKDDFAIEVSNGSLGLAIELCENDGIGIYQKMIEMLGKQSFPDGKKNWDMTIYLLEWLLSRIVEESLGIKERKEFVSGENNIKAGLLKKYSVDQIAELWKKVSKIAVESEGLRLNQEITAAVIGNTL